MKYLFLRTLCLLAIGLTVGCSQNSVPDTVVKTEKEDSEEFESSEQLLELLDQSVSVHGYSIRPPTGYADTTPKRPPPEGVAASFWGGIRRPDGTSPLVQLLVLSGQRDEDVADLEEVVKRLVAGAKQGKTGWAQSELSFGKINGRRFAKQSFRFDESRVNDVMQGIMYVAVSNDKIIQLMTLDTVSHSADLQIGEASLLTFE